MVDETKVDQFKKELKALLEKYDAEIYSIIEGDTHGIHYEAIAIDFVNDEVMRFEDSSISHYDIK